MLIWAAACTAVALIAAAWWFWRRPGWMGFSGRTLWDWLEMLTIPAVVGFGSVLLTETQTRIEADRAAEEMLQTYIDRFASLAGALADPALRETALVVAAAHTDAALHLLDGPRAGRLLRFLADIGLLGTFPLTLEGISLAGADLKGLDLSAQAFEELSLAGADLEGARLAGATFESVDLSDADLRASHLAAARFEASVLAGASLAGADLRGADLTGALGLEPDALRAACRDGATRLPAGLAAPPASPGCDGPADALPDDDGDEDEDTDGDGD